MTERITVPICEACNWAGEVVPATTEDELGTPLCVTCAKTLADAPIGDTRND